MLAYRLQKIKQLEEEIWLFQLKKLEHDNIVSELKKSVKQDNNCAWHPIFQRKVSKCWGLTRDNCIHYRAGCKEKKLKEGLLRHKLSGKEKSWKEVLADKCRKRNVKFAIGSRKRRKEREELMRGWAYLCIGCH